MIVGVGGWYVYARAHRPSAAVVDGTYHSECCGSVVLANGWIVAAQGRSRFDLEEMKFGLTAYPERQIRVNGSQVLIGSPTAHAAGILFSADRRSFTLSSQTGFQEKFTRDR